MPRQTTPTQAELQHDLEQFEVVQRLHQLASNMTEEEIAYSLDPTRPKPPPREVVPGPCECSICDQQFRSSEQQSALRMTYSRKVEDSKARALVADHMRGIETALAHLRSKLAAHGKAISSRWRKKSRDKRAAFLLAAQPALETKQWVVPRFINDKSTHHWEEARESRMTWLLPWLDVESLKNDPARLLGLLYNRARFTPEQWAPHDMANLVFGYNQGFLDILFSPLCVVMSGPNYGELVSWKENAAHRLDIIGFPRGQLLLAAQDMLLAFLCSVVDELTKGLDQSIEVQHADYGLVPPHIPRLDFKRSGHLEIWSAYINQPFSEPPKFDVDVIISLARARVNELGDHIWLMQTDASYMRRVIRTAVSAIPLKRNLLGREQDAHTQALTEIIMDNGSYATWKWILEDCETLKLLQIRYGDEICSGTGTRLPSEYDIALQSLEMSLSQQIQNSEKIIQDSFPIRSGFRDLYEFDQSSGNLRWRLKHGKRKDGFWDSIFFESQTLYWCVTNLVDPPEDRVKYPASMVFAFLDEYLASCSKEERAQMDERLYAQLSNYAALDEVFSAVQFHRPGPGHRLSVKELRSVSTSRHFRFVRSARADDLLVQKFGTSGGLTQPLLEFMDAYDARGSLGRISDKMRLQCFDAIQNSQNVFWSRLQDVNTQYMKLCNFSPEDIELTTHLISARSQPEFIQKLRSERQKILDVERPSSVPKHPPKLGEFVAQRVWGRERPSAPKFAEESTKMKRRAQQPVSMPSVETLSLEDGPESLPPMPVRQKAYTILNGMFSTNPESTAKTVDWDAFVTAMADAGFSARQSSGSAVIFEPDDWERGWSGKIVFHKPHPIAKIDSVMLRSIGRRMEKWFGWNKDSFIVQ